MNIIEIEKQNKQDWNSFIVKNACSFSQSYEWGEFRVDLHNKIWRFVVEQEGEWLATMFMFKDPLQLGQSEVLGYHGPVIKKGLNPEIEFEVVSLLIKHIDSIAKQEKIMRLEVSPLTNDEKWLGTLDDLGFSKSLHDSQPRHTLILDIKQEEEELLKQMHTKTRYNIRLAKKKGVEVEVDNSKFKEFWELTKKTQSRQNITTFSYHYFEKLLKIPFVKLYLAKYEGKYIAANLIVTFGNTSTYLFGSSDYEHRNIMAPYLLQWQAIKDSKENHIEFYDFWGAAPKDATGKETNWSGFTRFKMGFSPNAELTEYIGTYEKLYLPVRMGMYRFMQKIYQKRK
jgi:peptidoglycan pentaglycine glycine transferase (the first glycine)